MIISQSNLEILLQEIQNPKHKYDLSTLKTILLVHSSEDAPSLSTAVASCQTLAGSVFTLNLDEGILFRVHDDEQIGTLLPFCEAKIVNQRHEPLPVDQRGNLLTRGYHLRPDYSPLTLKSFEEGKDLSSEKLEWHDTKTAAMMDQHGLIRRKL